MITEEDNFRESLTQKEKRELIGRYVTNQKVQHDIDTMLESIASLECTLGIDSSQKEINYVKKEQKRILLEIKKLDPIKYKRLVDADISW